MRSVQIANHQASSAFLVNLFREQGITDFNLVPDNAKPRATVPRSVYLQSPKSDKKSVSRWDSIPRAESLDALDSKKRTRRRASSLGGRQRRSEDSLSLSTSSMSCIARENSRQNTLFEKPTSSLKHNNSSGSSALPHILRDNLLELVLVGDARFGSTPRETINGAAGTLGPLPPPTRQTSNDSFTDPNPPLQKPTRRRASERGIGSRSSSESSLRMPQRRTSIDSVGKPDAAVRPRRARIRASMDTAVPSMKNRPYWLRDSDGDDGDLGNRTDSTQELSPSPTGPLYAASKILNLVNTHSIHAPPLNSPSCLRQKASRRKSTGSLNRSRKQSPRSKSPPHQQPGTPPTVKCALRLPLEPPSKSPPLQRPGTPPSINREQRTRGRRHSDGIIDIDMEVSKKLLHLAQISSPVQPVRRRSFDSEEDYFASARRKSSSAIVEDLASDEEEEDDGQSDAMEARLHIDLKDKDISENVMHKPFGKNVGEQSPRSKVVQSSPRSMEEARLYIDLKDKDISANVMHKPLGKNLGEQSPRSKVVRSSPRSKARFSSNVSSSPRLKTSFVPRVTFSPRRMHSAPITGIIPREDDDESALLASFRRRKPFSPSSAFTKTQITTNKTGATTRSRTTNCPRRSSNRDIIKASLLEHGSEGEDLALDYDRGHSSMGTLEIERMSYLLPLAPSLDTPPHSRRKSLSPVAPALGIVAPKKKGSRRRSMA